MREPEIYRLPQLVELLGMSRATIYRGVRAGWFPCPIRLTAKLRGWKADSILEWIRGRPRVLPRAQWNGMKSRETKAEGSGCVSATE